MIKLSNKEVKTGLVNEKLMRTVNVNDTQWYKLSDMQEALGRENGAFAKQYLTPANSIRVKVKVGLRTSTSDWVNEDFICKICKLKSAQKKSSFAIDVLRKGFNFIVQLDSDDKKTITKADKHSMNLVTPIVKTTATDKNYADTVAVRDKQVMDLTIPIDEQSEIKELSKCFEENTQPKFGLNNNSSSVNVQFNDEADPAPDPKLEQYLFDMDEAENGAKLLSSKLEDSFIVDNKDKAKLDEIYAKVSHKNQALKPKKNKHIDSLKNIKLLVGRHNNLEQLIEQLTNDKQNALNTNLKLRQVKKALEVQLIETNKVIDNNSKKLSIVNNKIVEAQNVRVKLEDAISGDNKRGFKRNFITESVKEAISVKMKNNGSKTKTAKLFSDEYRKIYNMLKSKYGFDVVKMHKQMNEANTSVLDIAERFNCLNMLYDIVTELYHNNKSSVDLEHWKTKWLAN